MKLKLLESGSEKKLRANRHTAFARFVKNGSSLSISAAVVRLMEMESSSLLDCFEDEENPNTLFFSANKTGRCKYHINKANSGYISGVWFLGAKFSSKLTDTSYILFSVEKIFIDGIVYFKFSLISDAELVSMKKL